MSRGNLYVRFPDGGLRYGIYNGTCDTAEPYLFDHPDQAWDTWYGRRPVPAEVMDGAVEVDIATDYGGGCSWQGKANLTTLTEGHAPHGLETWGGWASGYEPVPVTRGEPDWAVYPE